MYLIYISKCITFYYNIFSLYFQLLNYSLKKIAFVFIDFTKNKIIFKIRLGPRRLALGLDSELNEC